MTEMNDFLDEKICPFCHKNNDCRAEQPTSCWCFETSIPKELIALVPENLRNKACICQSCVETFKANEEKFKQTYLSRH